MAAFGRAMCHADVSMTSTFADVIMVVDDVSVDLVNVDKVNGQRGSTCQRSAGPTDQSNSDTDERVPRVRFPGKRKRNRGAAGLLGSKG